MVQSLKINQCNSSCTEQNCNLTIPVHSVWWLILCVTLARPWYPDINYYSVIEKDKTTEMCNSMDTSQKALCQVKETRPPPPPCTHTNATFCIIPFIWHSREGRIVGTEIRLVIVKDWELGECLTSQGTRALFVIMEYSIAW